jgi:hypothetical protein
MSSEPPLMRPWWKVSRFPRLSRYIAFLRTRSVGTRITSYRPWCRLRKPHRPHTRTICWPRCVTSRRALDILGKAEKVGDMRTALAAIWEARGNLELLAELAGELDRRAQVNITVSAAWLTIRATILQATAPYPEAWTAIVEALGKVNGHAGN